MAVGEVKMPYCIHCGTRVSIWDAYCGSCGTPVSSVAGNIRTIRPLIHAFRGRRDERHRLLRFSGLLIGLGLLLAIAGLVVSKALSEAFLGWIERYWALYIFVTLLASLSFNIVIRKRVASSVYPFEKKTPVQLNTPLAEPTVKRLNAGGKARASSDVTSMTDVKSQQTHSARALEREGLVSTMRSLRESGTRGKRNVRRRQFAVLSSIILLIFGAYSLLESVIYSSSILTFIGLGLTFWGLLAAFIQSTQYARVELVGSSALSSVQTIDRIIDELHFRGRGVYLPAVGSERIRLFVPADDATMIPSRRAIGDKVILSNPRGLIIVPPGLELARFLHEEMSTKRRAVTTEVLIEKLPKLLTNDLEMMENFSIKVDGRRVYTRSTGSIFSNLCNEIRLKTRVCAAFGCPFCSAIACLLVDATGQPVMLESDETSPDGHIIETTYLLREGLQDDSRVNESELTNLNSTDLSKYSSISRAKN